ncbi:MAG: M23 family peptidase [Thermus sp.]|uniref:M23 family metallopeptidase n=1 Tax=Thermus sp. TaxID=275 RepID=UPI00331978EE
MGPFPGGNWKAGHYLLLLLGLYALVVTLGFALRGRQLSALRAEVGRAKEALFWAPEGYRLPIPGACLPSRPENLPNAPRPYRKGVNPGFIFVQGDACVPVLRGTGVVAAATGEVVKAETAHTPLSPEEKKALLDRVKGGATPEDMDLIRGLEVWIRHKDGRISVYAHLESVYPGLKVGMRLRRGDPIGYVGQTGLAPSARLLFELWEGRPDEGRFFGQGLGKEALLQSARALFAWPK